MLTSNTGVFMDLKDYEMEIICMCMMGCYQMRVSGLLSLRWVLMEGLMARHSPP
jgi:hypothetical protein